MTRFCQCGSTAYLSTFFTDMPIHLCVYQFDTYLIGYGCFRSSLKAEYNKCNSLKPNASVLQSNINWGDRISLLKWNEHLLIDSMCQASEGGFRVAPLLGAVKVLCVNQQQRRSVWVWERSMHLILHPQKHSRTNNQQSMSAHHHSDEGRLDISSMNADAPF